MISNLLVDVEQGQGCRIVFNESHVWRHGNNSWHAEVQQSTTCLLHRQSLHTHTLIHHSHLHCHRQSLHTHTLIHHSHLHCHRQSLHTHTLIHHSHLHCSVPDNHSTLTLTLLYTTHTCTIQSQTITPHSLLYTTHTCTVPITPHSHSYTPLTPAVTDNHSTLTLLYTTHTCTVTDNHSTFTLSYTKTTQPIFTKFGAKVAHWPQKKPLDFCGNPEHFSFRLG